MVLHQNAETLQPGGSRTEAVPQQRFSLHDRMEALERMMKLASEESVADQPLCPECTSELLKELEAESVYLEEEVAALDALKMSILEESPASSPSGVDERSCQREIRRLEEEIRAEELKLARAEEDLANALARKRAAEGVNKRLEEVEVSYWHAFNAVMLTLHATADFRDSLQQRVDSSEKSLSALRRTSVLSDLFRVWHDGPFGTISGLRLGSTPEFPVEWWEINAAWGQAALLLETLAKSIDVRFSSHKLEPCGSYSRVVDGRGSVSELYGPASKIFCFSFDRAQVGFLTCLKEFGEALESRGATIEKRNTHERVPFAHIYAIEGDKVGGQSIRYGLSRDKAWTKALKYMLVDLKYCLKATLEVKDRRRAATAAVAMLPREGPGNLNDPK